MKKIKYTIFMCFLFLPITIFAKDYDVTNYYLSVVVNENNVYEIREHYNVLFYKTSKFKRTIDLRPKVYLTNGKYISYIADISKVNSKDLVKKRKTSKKYEVTYPENIEQTTQGFDLSYEYNMGNDNDDESDIIFVNIIDGNLNINANTITFSIILPTDIKEENISIFKNGEKLKDKDNISYTYKDKEISGTITNYINKKDVYSLQIEVPNGFFKSTKRIDSNVNMLLLVVPFISLLVSLFLLKKYQREKIRIIENALSIINKYDSAEIAYLYKGDINASDLLSLLITLANDGYISIKNYGSKANINFKIKKEKEYDKDNAAQKIIFDGLFQNKDEVDVYDIEGSFYPYYQDAKRTLHNKRNKEKLLYPFAGNLKTCLLVTICIGFTFLQIKPLYNLLDSYIFAIVISIILSLLPLLLYRQKNKYIKYIFYIITIAIVGVECYALIDFKLSLSIYLIGIIISVISLYIEHIIPTRTIYGSQQLYETESLRLELASMKDDVFESKSSKNPNYFFDMIPYTLIFDLNRWWFKRFEEKVTIQPAWYESSEKYSHEKFREFIEDLIEQLTFPVQSTNLYTDELLKQAPNKKL